VATTEVKAARVPAAAAASFAVATAAALSPLTWQKKKAFHCRSRRRCLTPPLAIVWRGPRQEERGHPTTTMPAALLQFPCLVLVLAELAWTSSSSSLLLLLLLLQRHVVRTDSQPLLWRPGATAVAKHLLPRDQKQRGGLWGARQRRAREARRILLLRQERCRGPTV